MTPLDITITRRDGTREPFDADRINKALERACSGFSDATSMVMQIATETQLTIFDGVTEDELDEATINAALQNAKDDPDYDKAATRLLLKVSYKRVLGDFSRDDKEAPQKLHVQKFPAHIKALAEDGLIDQKMVELFNLEELAEALVVSRDELFNYAGLSGMLNRYSLKAKDLKALETPQFFFMRVAMGLSYNEEDPTAQAKKFYEKMSKHHYLGGGSTNMNSGTPSPAMSNCILLEVHDSMEHIAKSVSDILILSKASAGIGASITKLRASGSILGKSNTTSSGPIPFIKIIDVAARAVVRGGKKKGAVALYMENWHYNFPEFVEMRQNSGDEHQRLRTANTACFLSDEFFTRVQANDAWYLFDPKETPDLNELYGEAFSKRYHQYIEKAERGEIRLYKKIRAREQWRQILVQLQGTGHPWVVFKDSINLRALNNNTGTIHMSNLCTEICLPQDKDNISVCNLASINLAIHVDKDKKEILWQQLEDTVRTGVRHLDNLVDINVLPIKESQKSDSENRAVGLGAMGLADALEKMGYAYDSEEAFEFTDKVFEFISYMAIDESANLAQERGSYMHFEGSEWSKGKVPVDSIEKLERQRGKKLAIPTGSLHKGLDWNVLREKVKKGMRNATLMAVAPNANIGLLAATTPGFDARFAQVFSRNKISGKYLDMNTNLVDDLKKLNLWEQVREQIIQHQGDISEIEEIPKEIRNIYKTSFTTDPIALIEVAARAQKWIDQAISRNMYLATRDNEEIMKIYETAWEKGLKSTYYLHMKPRHTAEQSTIKVNKAKTMGKVGFGMLKTKMADTKKAEELKTAPSVPSTIAPDTAPKQTVEVKRNDADGPVDPQDKFVCESCQ